MSFLAMLPELLQGISALKKNQAQSQQSPSQFQAPSSGQTQQPQALDFLSKILGQFQQSPQQQAQQQQQVGMANLQATQPITGLNQTDNASFLQNILQGQQGLQGLQSGSSNLGGSFFGGGNDLNNEIARQLFQGQR